MNYSEKESMVRFSLFKPSGKWYDDIAIDMRDYFLEPLIHDAVKLAFLKSKDNPEQYEKDHKGWKIVCLEPYHIHSYPIMLEL